MHYVDAKGGAVWRKDKAIISREIYSGEQAGYISLNFRPARDSLSVTPGRRKDIFMACSPQSFHENDPADKVGGHDFTVGQCSLLRGHVLQQLALRPRCGITWF